MMMIKHHLQPSRLSLIPELLFTVDPLKFSAMAGHVQLRIDAEWKLVTIDDFIPCRARTSWWEPKARTLYAGISGEHGDNGGDDNSRLIGKLDQEWLITSS